MASFTDTYLGETQRIVEAMDSRAVEKLVEGLAGFRERSGRLFILGVGGSAGHASHAVNDFRKLCGTRGLHARRQRVRADRPDQRRGLGHLLQQLAGGVPPGGEATACWSSPSEVGTGSGASPRTSSTRWIWPVPHGLFHRRGGRARRRPHRTHRGCGGRHPAPRRARVTPHTEGLCAVVWHLLVSHPRLQRAPQSGSPSRGRRSDCPLPDRRRRRFHREPFH
jgi:D-sedoheptulose 7-phosphate isomerase